MSEALQAFGKALAVIGFAAQFCPGCRNPWAGRDHTLCPAYQRMIERMSRDLFRGEAVSRALIAGLDHRGKRIRFEVKGPGPKP